MAFCALSEAKGMDIKMEETKNLKPKSFRITDTTAEEFKKISAEIGGNQQETLAKLIETYEFQRGKVVLQDKKQEIEKFEQYSNILIRMFMGALEENKNMEELVYSQFDAQLQSKDSIIQNLQRQLLEQRAEKEFAVEESKQMKTNFIDLQNKINDLQKEIEDKKLVIIDKEKLVNTLTDSSTEQKEKIQELNSKLEHMKEYSLLIQQLQEENEQLKELVKEKEQLLKEKQLEQEKRLLEQEKNYQKQVNKIKEEKNKEINMYQEKYVVLLEKLEQANT